MDGKAQMIALVALTVLAWCGVRYVREHSAEWGRSLRHLVHWHDVGATLENTTMTRYIAARLIEPVIFTGFFVLTMAAWILLMLAAGLGPILTALSIAFPGSAVAYHLARRATTLCRRYSERG